MRYFYLYFGIISLLYGCKSGTKELSIWIENNSEVNRKIEVATYLNDSLVDKRNIEKDSIADRIATFIVPLKLPGEKKEAEFRFVISSNKEETNYKINIDSMSWPSKCLD